MLMLAAVLSAFVLALVAPWIHRAFRPASGWVLSLLPIGLVVYFSSLLPAVVRGEALVFPFPWVPGLDVQLSFYADGLSLLFAILISGIGALILIYAGAYLAGHPDQGRFFVFLLMFMGSMLGLVLSGNLIGLFVFWELTSISSYLLIGFDHEQEGSRKAALQALLVTVTGGLALMAGFVLLGLAAGSFEMASVLHEGEVIKAHPSYAAIVLLVLAGAFTKSAQFPFHFWLPAAMAAPTPVSAYLHSATMVKAGVYLMARLTPALGQTDLWFYLVSIAGGTTMLVGAFLALRQTDLKLILAYSTVSVLGTLTFLIGLGYRHAIEAAVVFLFAHSLYKGALFLVAGAIDHETGTRDVTRLGHLWRPMPRTAAAAIFAALSMAGMPPLLGFIGKDLIYEATLASATFAGGLTLLAFLANSVTVGVAGIVGVGPFVGRSHETPKKPHEAPVAMVLGPVLLATGGLLFGMFPVLVGPWLVAPAVGNMLGEPPDLTLILWHGPTLALGLGLLTIACGAVLFVARGHARDAVSRLDGVMAWGPTRWYDVGLEGMLATARGQTRVLQNGLLRNYIVVILFTTSALTSYALWGRAGNLRPVFFGDDVRFYEGGLALLIVLGAATAVIATTRLATLTALGVVGFGVALIFVLFGAPDLAMTQILVESLTVILLVLVFYNLRPLKLVSSFPTRLRDGGLALVTGTIVTVLLLTTHGIEFEPRLRDYFAANSVPMAHGRNIVNVILVDFRALDTLGEIVVLALAGVGVFALLKLRLQKRGRS
jgi:multicomponent Na+:H+ antiporter subunit A